MNLEWRLASIRNGMRDALAYRGDFLLDFFGQALVPVSIQLILWTAVFRQGGISEFGGMTYSDLIAYTWGSLLFSQIRGGDHDFSLIEMIRTGSLSNYLVRPVGVVEFTFYRALGEKLLTTVFCFLLGLIAIQFTTYKVENLLMGMMLAILGNIIHYVFGAALAAVAFYWENAFAVLMMKNMLVAFLSGEMIPLSIIPEKYAFIWQSTPFYLYVFGPTQVLLGKWDAATWAHHMMIGCVWLTVFLFAVRLTWSYSIKRYQGLGG